MKEYRSLDNLLFVARCSLLLAALAHTTYCLLFCFVNIPILAWFKLAEAGAAWLAFGFSWLIKTKLNLIIYYVRASLIFSCTICNAVLGVDYGFVAILILIVALGYIHNFKNPITPIILGLIEILIVIAATIFSFNIVSYESEYKDLIHIYGMVFVTMGIFIYAVVTEQISNQKQRQIEERKNHQRKNLEMDKLSGLYNRTTMNEILHRQVELFGSMNSSELCVALLDLDKFRKINEIYGHKFGDLVIFNISNIIKNLIASKNGRVYAGRWSGQEFIISAIETSKSEFLELLDKIRKEVEGFTHTDGYHSSNVTLSIGLCINQRNKSVDMMLAKADTALYNAKREGANRICDITLKEQ